MSRRCQITGKRHNVANRVSNANNRTKRRQLANIRSKRLFVPELGRVVRLRLSTQAIRTLDKKSLTRLLADYGLKLSDVVAE